MYSLTVAVVVGNVYSFGHGELRLVLDILAEMTATVEKLIKGDLKIVPAELSPSPGFSTRDVGFSAGAVMGLRVPRE